MGEWHPILSADEVEPGHWVMRDTMSKPYGIIRFLVIAEESGYRVVTWAEKSDDRHLLGYFRSFRAAAKAAHEHYVHGLARQGFAPDPWGRGQIGRAGNAAKKAAPFSPR